MNFIKKPLGFSKKNRSNHSLNNTISSSKNKKNAVHSGFYLLPNMITALSLFFGFLSLRLTLDGVVTGKIEFFVWSAYAILAAALCDGLDGSVARLTRTQTSFGGQLDSLCDLVAFGVAPAFLAYNFALKDLGRLGFAAAFIFVICGALRLARFNVQSSLGKASENFTGIPIPMAAIPVAIFVLAQHDLSSWTLDNDYHPWAIFVAQTLTIPMVKKYAFLAIIFLLALGMISTFEYISTKTMKLPAKRPFRFFAFVLIVLALLSTLQLIVTLALLSLVYCLHGPLLWLVTRRDGDHEEEELFANEDM